MHRQQKILIVDDSAENIKILASLLRDEYTTFFAKNGKTALKLARSKQPDLILLDIVMPEMDGFEVCRVLQEDPETSGIPVIFVSAKGEEGDETKGFEAGAVDYIIKPISPPIVQARVKTHLRLREAVAELKRLNRLAMDANPMTGLPGNTVVTEHIKTALENKENVCVVYADLDNFKAYNDKYGFAMGDDIILFTVQVLKDALAAVDLADGFVGHIGGDDFVAIVPSEKAEAMADRAIKVFDDGVGRYYNEEDLTRECISAKNRQGEIQTFPLMSISMAGVDLAHGVYSQYFQVIDACTEAKKEAKRLRGSAFFRDRRQNLI
ncbi:MAG: response regulator [Desulfobacteraceae bacterium]